MKGKLFYTIFCVIIFGALLVTIFALIARNNFEAKTRELDIEKVKYEGRLLKVQAEIEFVDLPYAGYTPMFVGEGEMRCFCKDNKEFLEEGIEF